MSDYDNSNRGVLFRNEDKKGDSHPDYKGQGEINGSEVWISAWIKTSKKGTKFMSLSFKPKEAKEAPRTAVKRELQDFDDPIGF